VPFLSQVRPSRRSILTAATICRGLRRSGSRSAGRSRSST